MVSRNKRIGSLVLVCLFFVSFFSFGIVDSYQPVHLTDVDYISRTFLVNQTYTVSYNTWYHIYFSISSGNVLDAYDIFEVHSGGSGNAYIDDVEVLVNGVNVLTNSGFEDGENGWQDMANRATVSSAVSHSGSNSIRQWSNDIRFNFSSSVGYVDIDSVSLWLYVKSDDNGGFSNPYDFTAVNNQIGTAMMGHTDYVAPTPTPTPTPSPSPVPVPTTDITVKPMPNIYWVFLILGCLVGVVVGLFRFFDSKGDKAVSFLLVFVFVIVFFVVLFGSGVLDGVVGTV